MSYVFYKFLHLVGVFMVLVSLGGVALAMINGASRNYTWKRVAAITHGIGLLIVLVSGFGTLARLGIHGIPVWVGLKMLVWLLLGAMIAVIGRRPESAKAMWWILVVLASAAAFLALYKPI